MGVLFNRPRQPQAPDLPPAPPAPPTAVDPAVRRARNTIRRRAALSGGRSSTIATGSRGLSTEALGTKKSLLGV